MGMYCPINICHWPKVPKSNKNELLGIFKCPPGIDADILGTIGTNWRNWKKDLKKKYFDPSLPLEDLKNIPEPRIDQEQYAKLDQMQTLTNELGRVEDDISRDDIYARINGPEKPRRVRVLGRGITQQDIFEEIPSRKTCFRMFQTLKKRLDKFEHTKNEVATPSSPSFSSYEDRSSSPISTNDLRPLRIHSSVFLITMIDRNEIVAKVYLKSVDPSTEVGGQVLGRNYYKVHINVVVKADKDLVRPYLHFNTIMDAQGVYLLLGQNLCKALVLEIFQQVDL
ncbi:hypothetical protein CDL12_17663 [Handroanthus impetiginosus]|uniref:Transposase Tnp1/En/Spm-like domain-containing protein n=1 Tax=Handroanthus impetiginosus TaxID=429701 RepID=A0A2G9GWX5_9LAMI|nr:hypothetical protein CDL12_17663 [Handroanthus impetiginosus]